MQADSSNAGKDTVGRPDPSHPSDPSDRARAVLDRLVRERAEPSVRSVRPKWVAVVGSAMVVVVLVVFYRRPPPLDEHIPLARQSVDSSTTSQPVGGDPPSNRSDDKSEQVVVHVVGAVSAPGVVTLDGGSRVVDAVTAAGGMRSDADPDRVNLAAPLSDGQRVVIPVLGQPPPIDVGTSPSAPADGETGNGGSSAAGPIDLNSADAAQLDSLPGVGPATASAIISHRDRNGPFTSVEDLLDVRGIGEAKLEALRDLVTVGGR